MIEGGWDGPKARLVLGGARSGKSTYAQGMAERSGLDLVFVATAEPFDAEMSARIALHVKARDARWRTVEAPTAMPEAIAREAAPGRMLLVDCLTLWLSNLLLRGDDLDIATQALVAAVGKLAGPVVFVSNEVGSGIVPAEALARRFRDAQGRLNQAMAAVCCAVDLVVAGLPLALKTLRGPGGPFPP